MKIKFNQTPFHRIRSLRVGGSPKASPGAAPTSLGGSSRALTARSRIRSPSSLSGLDHSSDGPGSGSCTGSAQADPDSSHFSISWCCINRSGFANDSDGSACWAGPYWGVDTGSYKVGSGFSDGLTFLVCLCAALWKRCLAFYITKWFVKKNGEAYCKTFFGMGNLCHRPSEILNQPAEKGTPDSTLTTQKASILTDKLA